MQMDDIKLFAKNKKELETLLQTICSQDIGMEFGREKCAMLMKSGKREITEVIVQPNQERNRMLREK